MDKPAVIHLYPQEPDWILFICLPPSIFAWTDINHSVKFVVLLPISLSPLQRGGLEVDHQDLCFLGGHLLRQNTTQRYRIHGSPNKTLDQPSSPTKGASRYLSQSASGLHNMNHVLFLQ